MVSPLTSKHLILVFSFDAFKPAASEDTIKDLTYKPCYVAGATGLPSLDNIPSVADLTASFAARKEERLKQEAEKKEAERRVSISDSWWWLRNPADHNSPWNLQPLFLTF